MPDPAPFPCTPFRADLDLVWSADPAAPGLQIAEVDPVGDLAPGERARLAQLFAAAPDLYAAAESLCERAARVEAAQQGAALVIRDADLAPLRAALARARGGE